MSACELAGEGEMNPHNPGTSIRRCRTMRLWRNKQLIRCTAGNAIFNMSPDLAFQFLKMLQSVNTGIIARSMMLLEKVFEKQKPRK